MMSIKQISFTVIVIFFLFSVANAQIPSGLTIENNYAPGFGLSIGKVFMLDGSAIVVHENQNVGYNVFKGMLLYQKDTLYTKQPGRLLLNMQDGSQLTVGSQSQLTLNKIQLMPKKKIRKSFISMRRGKARFNVRKLSKYKKTDYKIKTQTALIGVRGSDFIVAASRTSTSVTTFEKTKLEVLGLAKPHLPPTLLNDFQRVHVDTGDRPSDIEHVSPEEINQLRSEFKYSSKPIDNKKTQSDPKNETESESESESESDSDSDSESKSDQSESDQSESDQSQQSGDSETDKESENKTQQEASVMIPTGEIVDPSSMEQAQPPENHDNFVSNGPNTQNQDNDETDDQNQNIYEQIHEKAVMLPSFPETPK